MPFVAAPNIAQIRNEGLVDNQLTINDLYFELSGGGITPVNLSTLTFAVGDWFCNTLAPILSEDWVAVRTVGIDLSLVDGPEIVAAQGCQGGVAGEAAPNNVAACITLSSANRGRSGRGRNYIPAVPNSVITLNTLSSPFMVSAVDAYTLLVGAGTFEAGWQLVVLSRFTAGAARAVPLAFPVITASFSRPTVASMRSRSVGHGA